MNQLTFRELISSTAPENIDLEKPDGTIRTAFNGYFFFNPDFLIIPYSNIMHPIDVNDIIIRHIPSGSERLKVIEPGYIIKFNPEQKNGYPEHYRIRYIREITEIESNPLKPIDLIRHISDSNSGLNLDYSTCSVKIIRKQDTLQESIKQVSRDLNLKKKIQKDFLASLQKSPNHPSDKFAHSEFVIHSITDKSYPNDDGSSGISGWFKVEPWDFYYGGVEIILMPLSGIIDDDGKWIFPTPTNYDKERFRMSTIVKVGRIPWRNIVKYDLKGDEFYHCPHIYCKFTNRGQPYEKIVYYLDNGTWPAILDEANRDESTTRASNAEERLELDITTVSIPKTPFPIHQNAEEEYLNHMRHDTKDIHSALRTEIIEKLGHSILVKLHWGKDDIGYSLHISPKAYTMSGMQLPDILNLVGFKKTECPFHHGSSFCIDVEEGFNVKEFNDALFMSYTKLQEAERHLNECGLVLPQPEGWEHFLGQSERISSKPIKGHSISDGHTAPKSTHIKQTDDESFSFALSWLDSEKGKGWVTHYRSKHPPLSVETKAAFDLLGLSTFANCPEFDFESCNWRFVPFESGNYALKEQINRAFEAHSTNFSAGIEMLLTAHAFLNPFGFHLLPKSKTQSERKSVGSAQAIKTSVLKATAVNSNEKYDVALSFAGSNRAEAEELAKIIRDAGYKVFYDNFYPDQLWGKDLVVFFNDIYQKNSRYCVIFISQDYTERPWTNHERCSAQARALAEKGNEYILPIKVDNVELPGMPPTISYLSMADYGIKRIGELLLKKLSQ